MNPIYFSPPLLFVIALLFSMLGMGGSQLYIPVLFWLGMDFKTEAIPLGMLLNVVTSSSAAWTYGRRKLIDWKVATPFGITVVIFAPVGTLVNVNLPTKPVISIFALIITTAALLMLSGWKPKKGSLSAHERVIMGIFAGSILGFLAGLLGMGGGNFIVPLLYIAGIDMKMAAATSAMIVTFSGTSSFVSHIATAAKPDWFFWMLCVVSVFAGSQIGSRLMVTKLKPESVRLIFGGVLLGVATILIVRNVLL